MAGSRQRPYWPVQAVLLLVVVWMLAGGVVGVVVAVMEVVVGEVGVLGRRRPNGRMVEALLASTPCARTFSLLPTL